MRQRVLLCLVLLVVGAVGFRQLVQRRRDGPTASFLHLTDLHLDYLSQSQKYNASTYCRPPNQAIVMEESSPCSLRRGTPSAAVSDNPGLFGHYGCDSPASLIQALVQATKQNIPNPDFILVTGDFAGHQMHSENLTLRAISEIPQLLNVSFPDVPVYPGLGNNDLPSDYALECGPNTWLDSVWNLWQGYIPASEEMAFRTFGSYSSPLRGSNNTVDYGLDLIVFNTIFYSGRHVPDYKNVSDPCGQFDWLAAKLQKATELQRKVWILGHIPPGIDGWDDSELWNGKHAKIFFLLLQKYSQTIQASFFGHLHTDEFRIFSTGDESPDSNIFGALLMSPSVSPIFYNNPSFRGYEFNTKTYVVTNYREYYLNLSSANQQGVATDWEVEFSFLDAYGGNDVSSTSLGNLFNNMTSTYSLFSSWWERKTVLYPSEVPAYLSEKWKNSLCSLSSTSSAQFTHCAQHTKRLATRK